MAKPRGKPFPKGISPNPGGRPKQAPAADSFPDALPGVAKEFSVLVSEALKRKLAAKDDSGRTRADKVAETLLKKVEAGGYGSGTAIAQLLAYVEGKPAQKQPNIGLRISEETLQRCCDLAEKLAAQVPPVPCAKCGYVEPQPVQLGTIPTECQNSSLPR